MLQERWKVKSSTPVTLKSALSSLMEFDNAIKTFWSHEPFIHFILYHIVHTVFMEENPKIIS